ncbi:hypothetical protein B0F90DRAFT_1696607 [Multifurca ochricompacta]|uniref:Protein Zds1 C-terminal domain-containing protein n=1 Tax=Multifurca ochricompacta TaxID=376703 RepID=A0AAD4M993_9AGAM|nr:hypothetical protein B0F90DRAFT_1696607 [Multifurca ochricompacta]
MSPSQDEIQREVENLRDIKRRSTLQGGPGVLILDPDLPTPGAQAAAAQASYWGPNDDSSSDSHSHEDASGSDFESDDPFHLFWVPANMHPEIDPAQFRTFLKEHARAPVDGGLSRSESVGGASLGRKKSMLSRQYRPSENDGVEDERVVPLRRNRSSLYGNSGPQLTIKDLEKLDELAEEASKSRDPSKLRSVLRRSLSMNMSPSVIDNLDHAMPDPGEDADAPIIVPLPGQILRRAARTKIRKHGQTGEGAHRFSATRRGTGSQRITPPPVSDPRSSSDLSTSDHSDAESPRRQRLLSNESLDEAPRLVRPESYSDEAFIFDAYARDDINEDDIKIVSPPSSLQSLPRRSLSPPPPPVSMGESEPVPPLPATPPVQPAHALPLLRHPLPQRASSLVSPASVETPSRTPSPVTAVHSDLLSLTRPDPRPVQTPLPALPQSSTPPVPQGLASRREKEKDKDKKGLFKWGGSEKKGKKEQREKEKEASFFGSLFGSKKKQEDTLLGASKSSRGYVPPASPQLPGLNNYSRYPIHVERAIYRLSHIKLANPRRALYEQVLISNLMFWYLGVINKTQQSQSQQQAQRQVHTEQTQAAIGDSVSAPQKEQEQEEREERARVEVGHSEKEREARSAAHGPVQAQAQGQVQQQQPQGQQQQQSQGRRGSLTKSPPSSAGPRRAEQPVRGPQYDMQHRAMEQEYGAAFGSTRSMTTSAPAGTGYGVPPGSGTGPAKQTPSVAVVPTPSPHGLGAAAFGSLSQPQRTASPSRRSRSPPPPAGSPIRYVPPPAPAPIPVPIPASMPASPAQPTAMFQDGGRPPARSVSAIAAPQPMSAQGARVPGRKAHSAHAVLPPGARRPRTADSVVNGNGEEEDVPLALWQQQQQQQSLLNQQPRRR